MSAGDAGPRVGATDVRFGLLSAQLERVEADGRFLRKVLRELLEFEHQGLVPPTRWVRDQLDALAQRDRP